MWTPSFGHTATMSLLVCGFDACAPPKSATLPVPRVRAQHRRRRFPK